MQVQSKATTFIDIALPGQGVTRNVLLIFGFALFTAVAAQISATPPGWYASIFTWFGIPIEGTPVPITGQTLAVCATGAALGSYRAVASMSLYLLAGIAGLPVYAGSFSKVISGDVAFGETAGSFWSTTSFLSVASGGYIIGFIVAVYIIGRLAERGWSKSIILSILALLIGNIVIYIFGLPWLYAVLNQIVTLNMDLTKTLQFGLWPFIPGDLLKIAIVALALPSGWAIIDKSKR